MIKNQKYLSKLGIVCLLFFSQFFSALLPSPKQIDAKLKQVYDANFTQSLSSEEALEILLKCYSDSKSINYENGILKSGLALSVKYSNKEDCKNSIKISNEIEGLIEKSIDYKEVVEYYKSRALCYSILALAKESYSEYQKAIKIAKKIENADDRNYIMSVLYLDLSIYYDRTPKRQLDSIAYYRIEAVNAGEKISKEGVLAKNGEMNDWLISLNYYLGSFYLENNKIEKARIYFNKAKKLYDGSTTKMILENEISFLTYLSVFYLEDKEYENAIKYCLKSLEISKSVKVNPNVKLATYECLAKAYVKIGKQREYQKFMDKYIALSDSMEANEKVKTAESIQNFLSKKDSESAKKNSLLIYTGATFIIIIGFLFLIFLNKRQKSIHSRYLSLIERIKYQESTVQNIIDSNPETNITIPTETYQKLLSKCEKFEKNLGFLRKDMNLSYLSNQFDTNPNSLSFVINSSKGKSFSNYINDLRINYITKKLYEDRVYRKYKINYLAEFCGYSSSKVFANAFKKVNGVNPSYFIENLIIDLDS